MNVAELTKQLEQYPAEANVDAMFPTGKEAYWVSGTELITLADGRVIVVIDINAEPQLASA